MEGGGGNRRRGPQHMSGGCGILVGPGFGIVLTGTTRRGDWPKVSLEEPRDKMVGLPPRDNRLPGPWCTYHPDTRAFKSEATRCGGGIEGNRCPSCTV